MGNLSPISGNLQKLIADTTQEKRCPVMRLIESLPEDERILLNRVLETSASTRKIYLELRAAGLKIGRDSLDYHRRSVCLCQGEIK